MPTRKTLRVKIRRDGSLKIDATGMTGMTADQILATLEELATLTAGDSKAVKVEKHVHGAHTHVHASAESNLKVG